MHLVSFKCRCRCRFGLQGWRHFPLGSRSCSRDAVRSQWFVEPGLFNVFTYVCIYLMTICIYTYILLYINISMYIYIYKYSMKNYQNINVYNIECFSTWSEFCPSSHSYSLVVSYDHHHFYHGKLHFSQWKFNMGTFGMKSLRSPKSGSFRDWHLIITVEPQGLLLDKVTQQKHEETVKEWYLHG